MKIPSCSIAVAALVFAVPTAGLAADAGLAQGLSALAAHQHCDECHAIKEARIGPPFLAVAARYASERNAAVNRLALKIVYGGAGNWGTIPMVPNERISMDDARAISRWILALAPGPK
jgi:cytochrome c